MDTDTGDHQFNASFEWQPAGILLILVMGSLPQNVAQDLQCNTYLYFKEAIGLQFLKHREIVNLAVYEILEKVIIVSENKNKYWFFMDCAVVLSCVWLI